MCVCFAFSKKKSIVFRRKLLRFWVKGRKKSKLAARIRDWFFRTIFCFALTQRICDCVGFFTLSYRKMLTFFAVCCCFGLRVLCVCDDVYFCIYFQKRELFQYKLWWCFLASKPKSFVLCFKKVLCLKYVFLLKRALYVQIENTLLLRVLFIYVLSCFSFD